MVARESASAACLVCMASFISSSRVERRFIQIAIKWKAPCHSWVKVNSDGATAESGNWSAAGGILRDSHGNWLAGFCRFIGRGSALTIELWGILHGLEIAWQKGYTKVIIVSDNKSAVDILTDALLRSSATTLVRRIKEGVGVIELSKFNMSSVQGIK
ncbi:hypothetical protein J1N35_008895 [Gossypium stocksii]|uniref:RNase H type-1 domain-containing protein n=1 Tax=Gossypium stocksii TaxID=47602 RepID=A0A9D3WAB5_9ROSI|nr:hypothetical protein J1N35_008895 [Gossypium stocksii]